jgi:hypothetical protein
VNTVEQFDWFLPMPYRRLAETVMHRWLAQISSRQQLIHVVILYYYGWRCETLHVSVVYARVEIRQACRCEQKIDGHR